MNKNSYPRDIHDIIQAIIKHQHIGEDSGFPFDDEETLAILEANLIWVMNNVDVPLEKWKSIFKNNPKYFKRLSDILMTFSFETMVKNGEAVELQPENSGEKPIYMKKIDYDLFLGENKHD